ncbi:MAG: SDR family NAD(P)-dependent oxidoreductase [Deltaproteobacteria bacterium]|nr:SDR family NAD(P)-dependent oxidoreductase [Deltaproteobacteria bacterium]
MPSVFDLSGKNAIVTGAAGLLGTEHCLSLAEAGATVLAVDLDVEPCQFLCERIALDFGATASAFRANITQPDELTSLRDRVFKRFGRIDILVNNAAVDDKMSGEDDASDVSRFERFPLDVWQHVLNVNVTGTFLCCQVFGAFMAASAHGSIINIASTYTIYWNVDDGRGRSRDSGRRSKRRIDNAIDFELSMSRRSA